MPNFFQYANNGVFLKTFGFCSWKLLDYLYGGIAKVFLIHSSQKFFEENVSQKFYSLPQLKIFNFCISVVERVGNGSGDENKYNIYSEVGWVQICKASKNVVYIVRLVILITLKALL